MTNKSKFVRHKEYDFCILKSGTISIIAMKRILTIVCAMAIALLSASAQEKQHSLEITTGYPSILHFLEYPWAYRSVEMHWNGQTYKEHYQPGINIGYTYQWRKRWEVNTMVNVHLTIMDISQYPLLPGVEGTATSGPEAENQYDWNADPIVTRQTDVFGAFCASVRYKWLVRDNFSMYSALGAGISIGFPIPIPYVAPIGIKFGKGKVYGIVEANVSAATTFGMAGIVIRL